MLDFSIFIVSYNTAQLTCQCIESLLAQKKVSCEIIVVDNASQDDTVAVLEQRFGDSITLIKSLTNLGFGRANNLASTYAKGQFFYLINPDAKLTSELGLYECLVFMETHPQVGLLGTNIYEPKKQRFVKPAMHYPAQQYLKDQTFLQNLPGKIAWVLGASIVVPKNIYQEVSGFDEDFFLYGEETDLCLRIRQAGYELAYLEDVVAEHVSQATEQNVPPLETWLRKKRGFYLFCQKNYPAAGVHHIARLLLRRAQWRLLLLKFRALWFAKKETQIQAGRLRANIVVAKEVLAHL